MKKTFSITQEIVLALVLKDETLKVDNTRLCREYELFTGKEGNFETICRAKRKLFERIRQGYKEDCEKWKPLIKALPSEKQKAIIRTREEQWRDTLGYTLL